MAKIEIEDRAWSDPRLKMAAQRLKTGRAEVMGYLASVWHDSQQLGAESATADEIMSWIDCGGPPRRRVAIFEALVYVKFFQQLATQPCKYYIDGNKRRIELVQQRIKTAKSAADARWKRAPSMPDACTKHAPSNAESIVYAMPDSKTVLQADRRTEKQEDRKDALVAPQPEEDARAYDHPVPLNEPHFQSAAPPGGNSASFPLETTEPMTAKKPIRIPRPKIATPVDEQGLTPSEGTPTPGSRVWGAYALAYAGSYGTAPMRNAKNNALCKQLVDRLGMDEAEKVVRFYLTHRNSFYVQRTHPLDLCVRDAEGLRTQMIAGHRITSADARRIDDNQTTDQTFAAVTAKLKAEGVLR